MAPFRKDGRVFKAYWEVGAPLYFAQTAGGMYALLTSESLPPKARKVREKLLPKPGVGDEIGAAFSSITGAINLDYKVQNIKIFMRILENASKRNRKNPDCEVEIEVIVPQDEAEAFIQTLTDIRVLLGSELGIQNDDDEVRLSEHLNHLLGGDAELANLPPTLQQNSMAAGIYLAAGVALNSLLDATAN